MGVKNNSVLERVSMSGDRAVVMSMNLEQKVRSNEVKQLSLSDDGNWCAIAGGTYIKYFYLIDTQNQTQYKLVSKSLNNTLVPCFINGASDRLMIGGDGKIELWDINTRTALRVIGGFSTGFNNILCSFSVNN